MRPFFPALAALVLSTATLAGCRAETASDPPGSGDIESSRAAEPARSEWDPGALVSVEERVFAFIGTDVGSDGEPLIVPWIFETRVHEEGAVRVRSVRVGSGAGWEPTILDIDSLPKTPVPGRILPGARVRVLSSTEGAVDALFLRGAEIEAELKVGIPLAQWTVPGLGAVRFHRGDAVAGDSTSGGFLLDLTRSAQGESPEPGGWIFVHGGDGFQLALSEILPSGGSVTPPEARTRSHFRGWGRIAARELQWAGVAGEWADLRASERARRDIPLAWAFSSPDEELRGQLVVVSSQLAIGEGDGPLLPVEAFFLVRGHFLFEGDSIAVTGIALHRRR